ncbi:MAG: NUDIX hydrolase [Acidobacteriota bacterium]|nr:MAG: NUDIX hydrolase [Acidobacteriota bacterium]
MPETIATKKIYDGRIFDVRIDTIREGDAKYDREIISHRGSAVIVPLFDDGTVAMVRQYRHAAKETLLELPAGSLDEGEAPIEGAARELEEEIGYTAEKLEKIAEFYVSPGFLDEKMFVFFAAGLTQTEQRLEIDEIIEVERIPLADAIELVNRGEIHDAKTMLGLLFAARTVAQR